MSLSVETRRDVPMSHSDSTMQSLKSNHAGQVVFEALEDRQRMRRRSDLNRLFLAVTERDPSISHDEFISVFKTLQLLGAGKLIIGRKNNPDRFSWNYNLKELANVAKAGKPLDMLSPLGRKPRARIAKKKSKRGRPFGSKNKIKTAEPTKGQFETISLNIQVSPNARPQDIEALIELAKGLQK